MKVFLLIAVTFCFLAVLIGAIAAHVLSSQIEALQRTETFNTALLFHIFHSLALLFLCLLMQHAKHSLRLYKAAFFSFCVGLLFFSGSLYALSLGFIPTLAPTLAPIGGFSFLAAWLLIALSLIRNETLRKTNVNTSIKEYQE